MPILVEIWLWTYFENLHDFICQRTISLSRLLSRRWLNLFNHFGIQVLRFLWRSCRLLCRRWWSVACCFVAYRGWIICWICGCWSALRWRAWCWVTRCSVAWCRLGARCWARGCRVHGCRIADRIGSFRVIIWIASRWITFCRLACRRIGRSSTGRVTLWPNQMNLLLLT